MKASKKARIIGVGHYLPEGKMTNADLEKIVDTSDEWIVTRTGIRERRIAKKDEYASTMGAKAALKAIEDAQIPVESIDMIIVATCTADRPLPSTASYIQKEIGAKNAPGMDISAACTGFIYGLSMAKSFVDSGMHRNVLVVATEKMSSILNFEDRTTCVLFGDGAAAVVVSDEGAGLEIEGIDLGLDGKASELLMIPAGGTRVPITEDVLKNRENFVCMKGREVFKQAVKRMESSLNKSLEKLGLHSEDISWLIPHQANERIIEALGKRISISEEKIYKNVQIYGNVSAASVPIVLSELTKKEDILPNERLLLVAFGAGLSWGSSILRKIEN